MKKTWSDLDKDSRVLLEELRGALDAYAVQPAPPGTREAAARRAAALVRERPSPWALLKEQLRIQARFLPWWYYAGSLLLCIVGMALLLQMEPADAARMGVVIGFAPLPLLLGLLEVFHGADEGMGEIESACRYSPARVMSARMLIVGLLSGAIAAALGTASGITRGWLAAGVVVVPFCVSAALGLVLSAVLRGRASSAQVALAIALVNGAAAAMVNETVNNPLLAIPPAGWALAMAASALALAVALKTVFSGHSKLMERKLLTWN